MSTPLPAPPPPIDPETATFWAATTEGRLLVPRCRRCDEVFWYPRTFCPFCLEDDVELVEASGGGTIHSWTVERRPPKPYAEHAPYVLAFVELDEGPRLLTNVVDCDPEEVHIGQRVELTFDDTGEGSALYRFRPS